MDEGILLRCKKTTKMKTKRTSFSMPFVAELGSIGDADGEKLKHSSISDVFFVFVFVALLATQDKMLLVLFGGPFVVLGSRLDLRRLRRLALLPLARTLMFPCRRVPAHTDSRLAFKFVAAVRSSKQDAGGKRHLRLMKRASNRIFAISAVP